MRNFWHIGWCFYCVLCFWQCFALLFIKKLKFVALIVRCSLIISGNAKVSEEVNDRVHLGWVNELDSVRQKCTSLGSRDIKYYLKYIFHYFTILKHCTEHLKYQLYLVRIRIILLFIFPNSHSIITRNLDSVEARFFAYQLFF